MRKLSVLITTSAFAAVGPAIGALGFVIYSYVDAVVHGERLIPPDAGMWPPVFAWAYALGVIPALLTGLFWDLTARELSLRRQLNGPLRAVLGATIGAIVSAAMGAVLGATSSARLYVQFPLWGAVAAGTLATVFPAARYLVAPSNNRWRGP